MQIFFHIITHNIIPIFILIATGFILGKSFEMDIATLSKLNFYAFMPFFTFVTLYVNNLSGNFAITLLFASLFLVINTVLAYSVSSLIKINTKRKHVMINSVIMFNTGNIGIPLVSLIFAGTPYLNQALVIQITLMLIQVIIGNTIGLYNAGRSNMHWKDSILGLLKMPAIYSIIAALLLKQLNYDLTASFVWPAFTYIKQGMIGLVLVTLGIQLSKTNLKKIDAEIVTAAALRLIGGPATALLLLKLLGIEGVAGQVLFVASAAPTAVNAALISIERNAEPDFAAKIVALSTIICSLTMVFAVYFSKILFPI